MMAYPSKYPNTICIYEKLLSTTHPGTEMKVTPDKEALIIPNATMYQGDFRLPRKKASLFAFLPVKYDITTRTKK